jgi:predicted metalloprotease with PDZ domain
MRIAYEKYSGPRGYTPDDFRAIAEQVAGISLTSFWNTAVVGTNELDYSEALEVFGLRFRPSASSSRPSLGVSTRNDAGRLVVTQVRRDTPAFVAGLNVDDEILAIDDFRVRADRFEGRLDQYKPGDRVSILVARREQLRKIDVTFGSEPPRNWRLDVSPSATPAQVERLSRYLSAEKRG